LFQDQATDLVYEFNRLKERERNGETFRAVREIVQEKGDKIQQADKAAGGVVEAVVNKVAEAASGQPEAHGQGNTPPKKQSWWKRRWVQVGALSFLLGINEMCTGILGNALRKDTSNQTPITQRNTSGRSSTSSEGGSAIPPRAENGGGVGGSISERRSISTNKTNFVPSNPEKNQLADQPTIDKDFPSTASSYALRGISSENNAKLIAAIRVIEQDNTTYPPAEKAKLLKDLVDGYRILGINLSVPEKKEMLDLAGTYSDTSDVNQKKVLHKQIIDKLINIAHVGDRPAVAANPSGVSSKG
jgi:hypothetical protein